MICQVSPVKAKTAALPRVTKSLISSTPIFTPRKFRTDDSTLGDGLFWSPMTAGPYLVPVTRWVE